MRVRVVIVIYVRVVIVISATVETVPTRIVILAHADLDRTGPLSP
jgi:hypothetical protein